MKTVFKKPCFRCGIMKPLKDFRKRIENPDGTTGTCVECLSEYQRKVQNEKKEARKQFREYFV